MRRLDEPPTGLCALCDEQATRWLGKITELDDGRVLRRAVGVCDVHAQLATRDDGPDTALMLQP